MFKSAGVVFLLFDVSMMKLDNDLYYGPLNNTITFT